MPDEQNNGAPPPPPPPADDSSKPGPNSTPKTATVDAEKGMSVADGKGTDALGDQVHPDTQTSEADGHRTLANPVTDPGPAKIPGAVQMKNPDRTKGEHRYGDVNEPVKILQRQSTGHGDGYGRPSEDTHEVVDMAPDLAISGAASDTYHPNGGKTLTEQAQQLAAQPREPAPVRE